MLQKRNSILLVLITMVLLSSCVFRNAELKRQGFIYADVYQREYYAVLDTLTDPKATEAQKDFALQKKEVLKQLWIMIKVYDDVVAEGKVPEEQLILDITRLIDHLTKMGTGGG